MLRYAVFGGVLHSEVELPELRRLPDDGSPPEWTLRSNSLPVPAGADWTLLGEEPLSGPHRVRLLRSAAGLRVEYTDTGTFDIAHGGQLTWYPGPEITPENVRADVLGRVLASALHSAGLLCLHGSAVALGDGAVAFLAPRGHGKSTLASALTAAGGRLLTDDTLAVRLGAPAVALPGVHGVRLWSDSRERVGARLGGGETLAGVKATVVDLPEERVMLEPIPLRAVYLLAPVRVTDGAWACRRSALPLPAAALSLVGHGKLGALLSARSEVPVLLERASALSAIVPVFTLQVDRGWDQLDAVVAEVMRWHGAVHPPADLAGAATE